VKRVQQGVYLRAKKERGRGEKGRVAVKEARKEGRKEGRNE
jgi:hypothetical protein